MAHAQTYTTLATCVTLAGAVALAACGAESPALRVVVTERDRLAVRLDALRVEQWILEDGATRDVSTGRLVRSVGATPTYDGDVLEPWSLWLGRASDDEGGDVYRVRAAGVRDGDDYVRVEARVEIPTSPATLTLRFESACALRRCATGATCVEGRCEDDGTVGCAGLSGGRFPWCDEARPRDAGTVDVGAPDGAAPDAGMGCVGTRADCDGDPEDDCETDLSSSTAHCGACGVSCGSGETCVGGMCTCGETTRADGPACASHERCCEGVEGIRGGAGCTDVTSSNTSCGACGAPCPANESCASGACTCNGGPSCGGSCNGFGCGDSGGGG